MVPRHVSSEEEPTIDWDAWTDNCHWEWTTSDDPLTELLTLRPPLADDMIVHDNDDDQSLSSSAAAAVEIKVQESYLYLGWSLLQPGSH